MKYLIAIVLSTTSLYCSQQDKVNVPVSDTFLELQSIEELKLLETIRNTLYLIHSQLVEINEKLVGINDKLED